jgi:hypothetical protein
MARRSTSRARGNALAVHERDCAAAPLQMQSNRNAHNAGTENDGIELHFTVSGTCPARRTKPSAITARRIGAWV